MELARNVTSQRVIIMKRNCTNDKESATWRAHCSKLSSTLASLMLPLELLEIEGDIPLGTVISHACFDAQNEPVSWCDPVYQVSRSLLSAAMGRDSGELDLLDLGWTFSQAVALGGKDSWRKNIKDKKFSCFRHVYDIDWLNLSAHNLSSIQDICQDGNNSHFHQSTGCCRLTDFLRTNIKQLLPVLQERVEPVQFAVKKATSRVLQEIIRASNYSFFPLKNLEDEPSKFDVINPRIKYCKYPHLLQQSSVKHLKCDLFRRAYSDEGIAVSFNMDHSTQLDLSSPRSSPDILKYPPAVGRGHGLEIGIRDRPRPFNAYNEVADKHLSSTTRISISSPFDLPSLRDDSLQLEPGFQYNFLITPTQTVADGSLYQMSQNERECRFASENKGMVLFEAYTQSKCVFECSLLAAAERCGCRPWNYPAVPWEPELPICDRNGHYCHEAQMSNVSIFCSESFQFRCLCGGAEEYSYK